MQGGPGLPPVPALLLLPSVCLCLLSAPASTYPCACLYPLGPAACACLYVSVPVCVSLCLPIPTPCAYLYVPTSASCACFLHSPPILLLLANSRSLKSPPSLQGVSLRDKQELCLRRIRDVRRQRVLLFNLKQSSCYLIKSQCLAIAFLRKKIPVVLKPLSSIYKTWSASLQSLSRDF